MSFKEKVKNYWSVYNKNFSTLHATANSTTTALEDYNEEQCNIKDSDLLCLVSENSSLNENIIAFIWHWHIIYHLDDSNEMTKKRRNKLSDYLKKKR
eukprot:2165067-Ditylum_brightwellii.AAC.1